ncbi:MAG: hypothetical protein A2451_04395, partial [Bdellovibrionales bacterium RIFOXYC2_FULL_39_8]
MRGNSFGKLFSLTSFGESHGPAIGVIVDGVPSSLNVSLRDLNKVLSRRAPGKMAGTSTRQEEDLPEILSGVYKNKTLGTPIAVIVRNTNQRSGDYRWAEREFRVGHADKTTLDKYGIRDPRGGGRSSGRETIARVIAGYFASLIIPQIEVAAYLVKVGALSGEDLLHKKRVENYLQGLQKRGESVGGVVAVKIKNVPAGLGEPAFDKLKADLGKAFLSIGGCVAFSFGMGESLANSYGSENAQDRSRFGGIEGGISNGEDIYLEASFKPPSTVGKKAQQGRHDPSIVMRAIPVIESMAKIVLADHFLRQQAYVKE